MGFEYQAVRIAALACLGVAFLLFLISFGAPNWARTNLHIVKRDESIGLWRYCVNTAGGGQRCDDFVNLGNYGDWLKAVQSFMTLALFGMLGSIGIACVFVFIADFSDDVRMLGCTLASSFLTAVFLVISVGVFGAEYTQYFIGRDSTYTSESARLAWAWYLALVSNILTFASPVLILFDYLNPRE